MIFHAVLPAMFTLYLYNYCSLSIAAFMIFCILTSEHWVFVFVNKIRNVYSPSLLLFFLFVLLFHNFVFANVIVIVVILIIMLACYSVYKQTQALPHILGLANVSYE